MGDIDESNAQRIERNRGRTHWHGCWSDHLDCMDRHIDERAKAIVADALERVARGMPMDHTRGSLEGTAMWLRQPAPASEPKPHPVTICGVLSPNSEHRCVLQIKHEGNHESLSATWRPATPPQPTLAERLRTDAVLVSNLTGHKYVPVVDRMREAADALDAAERIRSEGAIGCIWIDSKMIDVRTLLSNHDKLRAEHEALRERYARLDAAAGRVTTYDHTQSLLKAIDELNRLRKEHADADQ